MINENDLFFSVEQAIKAYKSKLQDNLRNLLSKAVNNNDQLNIINRDVIKFRMNLCKNKIKELIELEEIITQLKSLNIAKYEFPEIIKQKIELLGGNLNQNEISSLVTTINDCLYNHARNQKLILDKKITSLEQFVESIGLENLKISLDGIDFEQKEEDDYNLKKAVQDIKECKFPKILSTMSFKFVKKEQEDEKIFVEQLKQKIENDPILREKIDDNIQSIIESVMTRKKIQETNVLINEIISQFLEIKELDFSMVIMVLERIKQKNQTVIENMNNYLTRFGFDSLTLNHTKESNLSENYNNGVSEEEKQPLK